MFFIFRRFTGVATKQFWQIICAFIRFSTKWQHLPHFTAGDSCISDISELSSNSTSNGEIISETAAGMSNEISETSTAAGIYCSAVASTEFYRYDFLSFF
jgi:hypothetical protein